MLDTRSIGMSTVKAYYAAVLHLPIGLIFGDIKPIDSSHVLNKNQQNISRRPPKNPSRLFSVSLPTLYRQKGTQNGLDQSTS